MSDKVKVWVPAGEFTETDLMAALDRVVEVFKAAPQSSVGFGATARAVDWLASKYGSRAFVTENPG